MHRSAPARRDGDDAGPVGAEHHPALRDGGGVVEVHDGPGGAGHGLESAVDQLVAGLGEHLDGDIFRDQILGDELAAEVEVGLGGGREADLDLLEAHVDEMVVHALLAPDVHRFDEGLVAVAQVDRAPQRRLGDPPVRPGAVRKLHRGIGPVLREGHGLGRGHGRVPRCGWMVVGSGGRGSGSGFGVGVGVVGVRGRGSGSGFGVGVRSGRAGTGPDKHKSPRPAARGDSASTDMWRSPTREAGGRRRWSRPHRLAELAPASNAAATRAAIGV